MKQEQIVHDMVQSHCEIDLTNEQSTNIWADAKQELVQMNATVLLEQMEKEDGPTNEMGENIVLEVVLSTKSFKETHLNAAAFQP